MEGNKRKEWRGKRGGGHDAGGNLWDVKGEANWMQGMINCPDSAYKNGENVTGETG